ncbi:MAG: NAD(P)-dependent glycerol-3-phosphate dehydrogenase [Candidatus Omnitrophica bacterium]|nr:NAD(P)-dependent glycerol-3-phosphate dehydrogenase [Candidatus Omnitrophota bacterium]
MHISILGDGGWGTTLAILLNEKGFQVTLWGAFEDYTRYLDRYRINKRFLPGVKIPKRIKITNDLNQAVFAGGDLIILSIPSQYMRGVLRQVRRVGVPASAIFLSVSKGIEVGSLKRMSEVMRDELKRVRSAVLSGPTIAREVAYGIPSVAVAASEDKKVSRRIQDIFMTERFRVYTNYDVAGVELGGSLKNIIAIACGISDGLGFGTNTKAALLSRGLVEISRLGLAMGARARTFSGISGLGDLVTTCISPYSRNRFVGVEIGKGKSLRQIQSHMQMVAEGVPTAKSAHFLSLKHKVEMPIAQEIYSVLYKNKSPLKALNDLMARSKKEE